MTSNFDKIENYLSGSMTEEQQLAFEKELLTNPALKEQVCVAKIRN